MGATAAISVQLRNAWQSSRTVRISMAMKRCPPSSAISWMVQIFG